MELVSNRGACVNLVASLTALALCFVCFHRLGRRTHGYVLEAYRLWTVHCFLWTVFWVSRTFWPEWTDLPGRPVGSSIRPASLSHFVFRYLTNVDSLLLIFAGLLLARGTNDGLKRIVRWLGWASVALFVSDLIFFTLADHVSERISKVHLGWSALLAALSVFTLAYGFLVRYRAKSVVVSSLFYGLAQVPAPFIVFLMKQEDHEYFLLVLAILKLPWVGLVTYYCGLFPLVRLTGRVNHASEPARWKRRLVVFTSVGLIMVAWVAHLTGIDLTELTRATVLLRIFVFAAVIIPAILVYLDWRGPRDTRRG